ncbi:MULTISPECIES: hypothetical protein [unclassified Methanoregula]|uniref:hypothetical protein n=1 Tax=unclassified Methanoregula TaxID=2649730 RepID=UPI0009D51277|nr:MULTISPECIES: hypothetical protein [unclassified Methanoregula]OPX65392.1 MAG: Stigma-specific protein, Stig1 [Methanoregula sp. PtaB.Bin085]OPY32301.1 MAG: Stigma-specific protein, Stig1 [Methanoregula sp. PtaU1.Bin006]
MSRIHHVFLFTVVILVLITAGCTQTTGPNALMTPQPTPEPTQVPAAPAGTGTIPPGAAGTQAAGTCNADTMNDAANCGGCGYACPANALCQQGQCYCKEGYTVENNGCVAAPAGSATPGTGCPAGMSPCPDGYCYELANDASNCGICGNQCPSGMICSASTCSNVPTESTTAVPTTTTAAATTTVTTTTTITGAVSPGGFHLSCAAIGLKDCGGTCVNTSTNNGNCGTCGNICSGLKPTCCGGTCTSLKSDESNCGTCGHKCGLTSTCENGSCKAKAVVTVWSKSPLVTVKVTVPKYEKQFELPGY